MNRLLIFVVQPDLRPSAEQNCGNLLLVGRENAIVLSRESERVGAVFVADCQEATRRHVENRGGERLVIEAHANQIAHLRRRKICRRFIQCHDDARGRIAANRRPHDQIVEQQSQQPAGQQKCVAVITEEILHLLGESGRRHKSLRPGNHNAEPLMKRKRFAGRKHERATFGGSGQPRLARTSRPRESRKMHLIGGNRGWQVHGGGGMINRERPAQAGDVPIEFIVVREKTKLTIRRVTEGVNVAARRKHHVGAAEVDALAIGIIFYAKKLVG